MKLFSFEGARSAPPRAPQLFRGASLREKLLAITLVAIAGCCHVGAASRPFTTEELEKERTSELERAGGGYEAVVVAPFVVVAEGPRDVRDDAAKTIAWAQRRLRADFFAKEPGKIITIWVWPDEQSYMHGASAVLGTIPSTPYGYYRPCSRALIVNAGLGYGTLVHEMVHAYMDADFPDAPVWLEEGFASLYEAPIEVGEHLHGATNWRLASLKSAIHDRRAPSFETMAKGSRSDFDRHEQNAGPMLYAVSRYLCFWLQEHDLMVRYYKAFRDAVDGDPTGMKTLATVTGRDLTTIRGEWEAFVAQLVYVRT